MANARRAYPELQSAEGVLEAARDAQVVVLLTEWQQQFRSIDPAVLGDVVGVRSIVDGRHALDPVTWREAGWHYRALGCPA